MDDSSNSSKENCFVAITVGAGIKYKCLRCDRLLSSKRNVMIHLHSAHGMSPVKPLKKKYLHTENLHLHVPRSTLYRWRKKHSNSMTGCKESTISNFTEIHTEADTLIPLDQASLATTSSSSANIDVEPLTFIQEIENGASCEESPFSHPTPRGWLGVDDSRLQDDHFSCEEMSNDGLSNCVSDCVSNTEELSDDETTSLSSGSYESTDSHYSSESDDSTIDNDREDEQFYNGTAQLSQQEQNAFAILSVFMKHNLSATASKDILGMMKKLFPDSDTLKHMSFESLWKVCGETSFKEYHYCHQCNAVFPEDQNAFRCATPGCDGLRFMGPDSTQTSSKVPRHSFVLADIDRQLQHLIKTSDNWEQMCNTKRRASSSSNGPISDITSASFYQSLCAEDSSFLAGDKNISAIFNTDGLCLYSSSRIELWPIFLAINELPPERRFARENILLVGMWQGKGKPPFYQYMKAFSDEMNRLYHEGVHVDYPEPGTVKLGVICGTLDLPAKAGVLNMTQDNGAEACVICEEPGMTVRQGNGHSRCYPYRSPGCLYPVRDQEGIKANMDRATSQNRKKGFRGKSGLVELTPLDLSKGVLPDYMHSVLLGVVKVLMHKWFSPTQSGKAYFVGKKLKTVSKRLMSVKPSDLLERLPRDLEKHYHDLKATEYQAWLLYYCIACMSDILPAEYLHHVALLAEGIHILLGDAITDNDLVRASALLDKFYHQFAPLYGQGSCGLNVHNIGGHLCQCVQRFGPLWAWSCFPFEDSNSFILHAVHGTGNVAKQVLRYRNALSVLRASMATPRGKQWSNMKKADGCLIAGSIQCLPVDDDTQLILQKLGLVRDVNRLQRVLRVQVGGTKFYSKMYKRMAKKICYIVLTRNDEIASIKFFVLDLDTNKVYAFVNILNKCDSPLSNMEGGKHLQYVRESQDFDMIHVQDLREKLFFIKPSIPGVTNHLAYVVRSPNLHGHAVFK